MNYQITVCVCSQGLEKHLHRILTSLSRQNFKGAYKVLVLGDFKEDFFRDNQFSNIKFKESNFKKFLSLFDLKFLPIKEKNISIIRNRGLKELANSELVYFLDEDCSLSHSNHLQKTYDSYQKGQWDLLGNPYQCTAEAFFAKAYNHLCNMWFTLGRGQSIPHLLGGNLVVGKIAFEKGLSFSENYKFGGEEIDFASQAVLKNLRIQTSTELSVNHHCSHDAKKFFLRSWQQKNRPAIKGVSFFESLNFFLRDKASLKFKIAIFAYLLAQKTSRMLRI